mmetsp:Transcript_30042/g.82483  ORF Transcript_30042/g.82483 Transcript_30042/m.82483 type:complete len:134 (+) Transcript_30042:87-488(+)
MRQEQRYTRSFRQEQRIARGFGWSVLLITIYFIVSGYSAEFDRRRQQERMESDENLILRDEDIEAIFHKNTTIQKSVVGNNLRGNTLHDDDNDSKLQAHGNPAINRASNPLSVVGSIITEAAASIQRLQNGRV